MKISCDIIRDILPLYAENMTSQASNEMVDEHLRGCEGCKGYLEALHHPVPVTEKVELKSLGKVRKSIQKRTFFTTVTLIFLIVSVFAGAFAWLYHPIWLSADEAILAVEEVEHGGVQFTVPGYVTNEVRAGAPSGITHAWMTNHLAEFNFWCRKTLNPEDAVPIQDTIHGFIETSEHEFFPYHPELADKYGVRMVMTEQNHWYWDVYEGRITTTLWDAGYPMLDDDYFINAQCITKEIFWTAVCIFGISLLISLCCKTSTLGKCASVLSLVAGSHVIAALLMTDGNFFPVRWVSDPYPVRAWIWMLTTLFAVTALLIRKLVLIKKQDTP